MALPHIILFKDETCRGEHWHVFQAQFFIDANDAVSSFIILEGHWQFFVDANFRNQMGPGHGVTLGPGIYNRIDAQSALGWSANDQLSSLKPV